MGIALLAASCTDDYTDWANPQSNPQEDAKSVSLQVNTVAAIDYDNVSAETVQIYAPINNVEEGADISATATLYNDDKSLNYVLYPDENGNVDADQLRAAVEYLYGLDNEAHEVQMDIEEIVTVNGQAFRMNNNTTTVTVKTTAGVFLELGHKEDLIPMTGDPGGKVFTYTFDNPGAATTVLAYTYRAKSDSNNKENYKLGGSYEDPELDGTLGKGSEAFVINVPFRPASQTISYTVTIDLENNTYVVLPNSFNEFVYIAGDGNGWGAQPLKLVNANTGAYQGFYYVGNEYKFRASNTNWDTNWGGSADALVKDGDNIPNAEAGFYRIDMSLSELKCSLTPITTIGVIGAFDGNSWSSDVAKLSYNTSTGAWEGTCDIPAGVEFKFRANDAWTINWGGDFDNLTQDGGNLKLTTGGTYKISLKLDYPGAQKVTLTLQ